MEKVNLQKFINFLNSRNPVLLIGSVVLIALIIAIFISSIPDPQTKKTLLWLIRVLPFILVPLFIIFRMMNSRKNSDKEQPFEDLNRTEVHVYPKHGEKGKSPEFYDEAINANPSDAWAFYHRANSRFERENMLDAIKDYDEALRLFQQKSGNGSEQNTQEEIDNVISRIYAKRGAAHMKSGDIDGGMQDLKEASKRSPDTVKIKTSVQIQKFPRNK